MRRSAEQLLDSISQVLNIPLEFSQFPGSGLSSGTACPELPRLGAHLRFVQSIPIDRRMRIGFCVCLRQTTASPIV